jgi:hypothetical protein
VVDGFCGVAHGEFTLTLAGALRKLALSQFMQDVA